MDCIKHQVHQEFGEDCPGCIQEEQAREDDAMGQAMDMLTAQEQASGTDVLPTDQAKSDCSGCPLYQAKQHKSGTVSVELTRAELDWLRVAVLCSHMRTNSPETTDRIYKKLKRSSK